MWQKLVVMHMQEDMLRMKLLYRWRKADHRVHSAEHAVAAETHTVSWACKPSSPGKSKP